MCFYLYLGAESKQKLIPWDESDPQLCVEEVEKDDLVKLTAFSKPNIYYVGSHEGCGCGFRQEVDVTYAEHVDLRSKNKNQQALFSYVSGSLANESSIELYGVWAGDERRGVETKTEVNIIDLINEEFYFGERELTIVKK
jgi:hypothetical protein